MRLEEGGIIQIATDHQEYCAQIRSVFEASDRFKEVPALTRAEDEQTDFEQLFLKQGLPIGACAYQALRGAPIPLPPLELDPEALPRKGEVSD